MKDEMGILKEVASISAGNGSIALSEILGKRIHLELPDLDILPGDKLLSRISLDQMSITISTHILTGIKGNVLFVLDEKSAFELVDTCYRKDGEATKEGALTAMGMSIIKEVGNVVISSYVGALGIMLKTLIVPSIPTLVNGPLQETLGFAISPYNKEDFVLFLEAVFNVAEHNIKGSFYLLLNPEAMRYIQDACHKTLESINES